jgi:tetratricopeptide (TPR) repeat protein
VPPAHRGGGHPHPLGTAIGLVLIVLVACGSDPLVAQVDEANAQFARGDVRAALTKYRDLQLQRPGVPELAVNVGNALQELGDIGRSLTSYQQALDGAKGKTRAAAYYDRGNALFHLGRLDDARAAYVDALKVDPTDHDAKFNIEVIDKLLAQLRPQQQQNPQGQPQQQPSPPPPGPGQSQQPQTGQQGQPQPGGQPQGGPSPSDNRAGASSPPTVNQALTDFRKDLGLDEALRLLDALRGEQRGIEGFIEGQGTRRGNNVEVPY